MMRDDARWVLTTHAITRFRERVRPGLSWTGAEKALFELLASAEWADAPPSWLAERQRTEADAYLLIGDVVLPLAASSRRGQWLVKTCLTRGGISEMARLRRNETRRARRRPEPDSSRKGNRRRREFARA